MTSTEEDISTVVRGLPTWSVDLCILFIFSFSQHALDEKQNVFPMTSSNYLLVDSTHSPPHCYDTSWRKFPSLDCSSTLNASKSTLSLATRVCVRAWYKCWNTALLITDFLCRFEHWQSSTYTCDSRNARGDVEKSPDFDCTVWNVIMKSD